MLMYSFKVWTHHGLLSTTLLQDDEDNIYSKPEQANPLCSVFKLRVEAETHKG